MKRIWLSFWDGFEAFMFGEIDAPLLGMIRSFAWLLLVWLAWTVISKACGFIWSLATWKMKVVNGTGQPATPITPKLHRGVHRFIGSLESGIITGTLSKDPWERADLMGHETEIHALNEEHAQRLLKQQIQSMQHGRN